MAGTYEDEKKLYEYLYYNEEADKHPRVNLEISRILPNGQMRLRMETRGAGA